MKKMIQKKFGNRRAQLFQRCLWFFPLVVCMLYALSSCSDESELIDVNNPKGVFVDPNEYVNGFELQKQADIKVIPTSASASAEEQNNPAANMIDGKAETFYHSPWTKEKTTFPVELSFTFEGEGQIIDYFIYRPRTTTRNGCFGAFEVWARCGEESEFSLVGQGDYMQLYVTSIFSFKQPLRNPKEIKFVVADGYSNVVCCSEMEFYTRNAENYNPLTLFTDESCSELKSGIGETEVEACPVPFYKRIAQTMLEGNYPVEARIQTYHPLIDPNLQGTLNRSNGFGMLEGVTGIYVDKGEELVVLASGLAGEKVDVRIQDLTYTGGNGYGQAKTYPLVNGANVINPETRGLVYVIYHKRDILNAPDVKIHFATGQVNGYFDVEKHDDEYWRQLLDHAVFEYMDVLGKYSQLCFGVDDFKNYTKSAVELTQVYDEILLKEQAFCGLEKYDRMHKNRLFIYKHSGDGNLAAPNGQLACAASANTRQLLVPNMVIKDGIWGVAHEIGHLLQVRPHFKWHGMTEVTNNICSIFMQTYYGNKSRFLYQSMPSDEKFSCWYERAMTKYGACGLPHNYTLDDNNTAQRNKVLTKVVPFWQLYLYLVEVRGLSDAFIDLYDAFYEDDFTGDNGDYQMNMIRQICRISQLNLLPFFKKSGFLTPANEYIGDYGYKTFKLTESQISSLMFEVQSMNYPAVDDCFWLITDENKELFKNPKSIVAGSATLSGRTFTMTDWQHVVAYEVETDGKLVYVSPMQQFTIDTTPTDNTKVFAVNSKGQRTEVTFKVE